MSKNWYPVIDYEKVRRLYGLQRYVPPRGL